MKTNAITALVVVGTVVLIGIIAAGTLLGFRSDCVQAEAGIEAQYKANQSDYDNMWKRFREMTQVTDMYSKDLKDVWSGVISGRYGTDGSKQLLLAVKEDNPRIDSAMYTKIQTAIEAGRTQFNQNQAELLDRKRQYETVLKGNTAIVANVFFGFPHIDLSKYDIVTSAQTDQAFTEKKADEIKLR